MLLMGLTDITTYGTNNVSVLCLVCNTVMKDATCGPCGHSLCRACMKSVLWGSLPCPTCGVEIKIIAPNFSLRRKLAQLPLIYTAIAQLERANMELTIRCDEDLAKVCMGMLLDRRSLPEIAKTLCRNYPNINLSCFIQHIGENMLFPNPGTALNYFQAHTPNGTLV